MLLRRLGPDASTSPQDFHAVVDQVVAFADPLLVPRLRQEDHWSASTRAWIARPRQVRHPTTRSGVLHRGLITRQPRCLFNLECDQYGRGGKGPYFYQLLHSLGVFPAEAPASVRLFSPMHHGQLTPEQLLDRYDLACRPVRDLLVDYLRERQPALDFTSLTRLANHLGHLFWKDLETHHPGIDSLNLAPNVAAAWKRLIQTKPARTGDGSRLPHSDVASCLIAVRAFYLDIAQWAAEDPARWGQWAVRCPIRAEDVQTRRERSTRKSRMDQRPGSGCRSSPALAASADRRRREAADLLRRRPGKPWRGVHRGRADPAPRRPEQVLDTVTDTLPAVAEHLDTARADILAFTSFRKEIWRQIWSNNPNERLNKEILKIWRVWVPQPFLAVAPAILPRGAWR